MDQNCYKNPTIIALNKIPQIREVLGIVEVKYRTKHKVGLSQAIGGNH